MRRTLRCRLGGVLWIGVVTALVGCGDAVREDRAIEFSPAGDQVSFQHGGEGVYVADGAGGAVKVFQPDEQVVATSPPLASPVDGRWMFTTATPVDPRSAEALRIDALVPPEGRVVARMPVNATCWLREAAQGDEPPTVRELFSTPCDHAGYVAAGLLARWHPSGERILYVGEEPKTGRRTLYEFVIATGQVRRVFPHAGEALCFDWSPLGTRVACVVGNAVELDGGNERAETASGVWLGVPGEDGSWARVPRTHRLASGEFPGLLDRVRASRPSWTLDERSIACPTLAGDVAGKTRSEILRVDVATRNVKSMVGCEGSCFDLHWSPDGKELGFVERAADGATGTLRFAADDDSTPRRYEANSVRRFAGWSKSGREFAVVTAEDSTEARRAAASWALLLPLDSLARDAVWVVGADARRPARQVFSGMRVTFPRWSPVESQLSLWLTFCPQHRSLLSLLARLGLTPGDPAATIDVATGAIRWLAVSPQEELQIGHYHLLKGRPEEALNWYERARPRLAAPVAPSDWDAFVRRLQGADPGLLFESLCLRRLGRGDDAARREAEFESTFFPRQPAKDAGPSDAAETPTPASSATLDALFSADPATGALVRALIHDLYVAEVFLSVDAIDEGLEYFRRPAPESSNADEAEAVALSRAILLGQFLLIAERRGDYLRHGLDELAPRLAKRWQAVASSSLAGLGRPLLEWTAALALAPLSKSDFYEDLPTEDVRAAMKSLRELRKSHATGRPAVAIDVALRAVAGTLDDSAEAAAASERLRGEFSTTQDLDEAIERLFEFTIARTLGR